MTRILTRTTLAAAGAMMVWSIARASPAPITAHYRCDDGTDFVAVFDRAGERATVRFADRPALVLPQAISGSGFRYSDGRRALHGKGDEALWIVDGTVALHCRDSTSQR